MFIPTDHTGAVNLQATLSAATATGVSDTQPMISPHHPITCGAGLYYNDDGVLSCDHAKTEQGDPRTQAALNHSMALLIIEFASAL